MPVCFISFHLLLTLNICCVCCHFRLRTGTLRDGDQSCLGARTKDSDYLGPASSLGSRHYLICIS